jgi:soluble lytic murein transglycosylase-like protein
MTVTRRLTGVLALALIWTTPATAGVPYTVQPGETLWSIAAGRNLTTRALAAANGLPESAQIIAGTTLTMPSEDEAAGAGAPPPAGAYVVRPGDTLTAIAARSGVTPGQVAFMNGLASEAELTSGTVLKLPSGAPATAGASGAQPIVPSAAPHATGGVVTAERIGQIAGAHGAPPALAAAIAWQESGFHNDVVSSANARGVMQIVPGTWSWVQGNLARHRLDPSSPEENVHAGVMYLNQLIRDAGGDEARAVAGYYQGPASVRSIGMLPDTQRYVSNVMALRARFGGE